MGCSVEDLLRWFRLAMGDLHPRTSLEIDGKLLIPSENPLIEISGFSRPARSIALLNIPVLDLRLRFSESLSDLECKEAIKRFDLYTRRGGG
jgi:hypothetical protein